MEPHSPPGILLGISTLAACPALFLVLLGLWRYRGRRLSSAETCAEVALFVAVPVAVLQGLGLLVGWWWGKLALGDLSRYGAATAIFAFPCGVVTGGILLRGAVRRRQAEADREQKERRQFQRSRPGRDTS